MREAVGRVFPHLRSYRTYISSFRADWGFLLAAAMAGLNPLPPATLAARFTERLGGAGLRFYGPAVHRAMFILSEELARLIGQAEDEESGKALARRQR